MVNIAGTATTILGTTTTINECCCDDGLFRCSTCEDPVLGTRDIVGWKWTVYGYTFNSDLNGTYTKYYESGCSLGWVSVSSYDPTANLGTGRSVTLSYGFNPGTARTELVVRTEPSGPNHGNVQTAGTSDCSQSILYFLNGDGDTNARGYSEPLFS